MRTMVFISHDRSGKWFVVEGDGADLRATMDRLATTGHAVIGVEAEVGDLLGRSLAELPAPTLVRAARVGGTPS
jgi:hypothetical protein